jgi:hypothetical protein
VNTDHNQDHQQTTNPTITRNKHEIQREVKVVGKMERRRQREECKRKRIWVERRA